MKRKRKRFTLFFAYENKKRKFKIKNNNDLYFVTGVRGVRVSVCVASRVR